MYEYSKFYSVAISCIPHDYRLCSVNKKSPAFVPILFNVVLQEGGGGRLFFEGSLK